MFARVFRRSAAPTRAARQYRALVKRDGAPAAIETFEDVVESPSQPIADSNVTVRVSHSCLNYKDGLVVCGRPGVARFPVVPGINLAGEVAFDVPFGPPRGTRVVCVNDHLGQRCDGGYAEFARLPTQWLTALPDSMDNHTAMAMGTAGFTAGQEKGDSTSLQCECFARARSRKSIHASRALREMIARPKISRNEWKPAEI